MREKLARVKRQTASNEKLSPLEYEPTRLPPLEFEPARLPPLWGVGPMWAALFVSLVHC